MKIKRKTPFQLEALEQLYLGSYHGLLTFVLHPKNKISFHVQLWVGFCRLLASATSFCHCLSYFAAAF